MLSFAELRSMSDARGLDAKAVYNSGRYGGAFYIVGYAVEYRLKGRIATSLLRVGQFPRHEAEFDRLAKIKSHRLDELLKLSGRASRSSMARRLGMPGFTFRRIGRPKRGTPRLGRPRRRRPTL